MQQYQTRIRRMRQPGRHHGRSTDGIRKVYFDPEIRAARRNAIARRPRSVPVTAESEN
jgi:hypothetical protein